jgi:tetratricopeptide (TPR) repeat protein
MSHPEVNSAELMALGRTALLDGRLEDAAALLKGAIEAFAPAGAADPSLAMIYFNLAECRRRLGQFEHAEANLRRAIQSMGHAIRSNPAYVEGYLVLGSFCLRVGKPDAAVRVYRAGVARNPEVFLLRERLCGAYALAGDFAAAFEEADEIARRRNLYTDHLRVGAYAVALGQFETAERAFQTSLERNSASWEGHYNLAELYMSARWMDRAREHYKAALDRNTGAWEPFNGMGLFVLMVDQDCDRAIALLQQALELAPSRPEPRWNLALAYARKHDFPAAQKFVASVLALVPAGDPLHHHAERLQATIRIENRTFHALR